MVACLTFYLLGVSVSLWERACLWQLIKSYKAFSTSLFYPEAPCPILSKQANVWLTLVEYEWMMIDKLGDIIS